MALNMGDHEKGTKEGVLKIHEIKWSKKDTELKCKYKRHWKSDLKDAEKCIKSST